MRSSTTPLSLPMQIILSTSKLPQEGRQISLLFLSKSQAQNKIEKFHGVLQRQAAAVMQIRRALLNASQGEGLNRSVARFPREPFDHQVVQLMVHIGWGKMAAPASAFSEKNPLPIHLAFGSFRWVETTPNVQFRSGRKIEHILHLSHVGDLDAVEYREPFLH